MHIATTIEGLKPARFNTHNGTLILTTVAINILALAVPVTTLQVYDRIVRNPGSTGTLDVLVAGVCIVILLDIALRLSRSYLLSFNGARYVHQVTVTGMRHVLAFDGRHCATHNVAAGLNSFAAIRSLRDNFSGHTLTVAVDVAFVPIYLAVIWSIGGAIVLVPLVVILLFTLFSVRVGLLLKRQLESRRALDDKRYDFLIRTLNAIHSVKALAAEHLHLRRYEALHDESCRANHRLSLLATSSFNKSSLFSQIMKASVVGAGAYEVIHGQLTVGALIAVVLVSSRIMQPIQRGLVLWVQYQDVQLAKRKVQEIFATPRMEKRVTQRQPIYSGCLEFKNLTFQFTDAGPPLLGRISLKLGRGDAISIGGHPGSGKSTLLKVIAGMYRCTGGDVLIDGISINEISSEQTQRIIGLLSAAGTVFRGTIRDNVTRFGAIPFSEAVEVIATLGLKQEFSRLPQGFDTPLAGTITDPISPGLKQLIAILRVLVNKPRIILFDNADMYLDQVSYQRLYRALATIKRHTTLVIVSNDQNFLSLADRDFLLRNGSLSEKRRFNRTFLLNPGS
jgi:ATP-binding cassette, subfamily C, bacterial LapB